MRCEHSALVAVAFGLLSGAACLGSNPDWGDQVGTSGEATTSGSGSSGSTTTSGSVTDGVTSSTEETSSESTGESTAAGTTTVSDASSGGEPTDYPTVVVADNPLAYWRLEEQSGPDAVDEVGGPPGTYLGQVELGHPGLVKGSAASVYFPGGAMDFIRAGNVAGFAGRVPFSVEAWVLADDDSAGCIIGKRVDATQPEGWFAASHLGRIRFERLSNRGFIFADHPELNAAFHLVLTYDGFTERMYINGEPMGSAIDEVDLPSHTDPLLIGDCTNWGNFAGFIDEVAVYDYQLAPDQISDHYNAGT